MNVLNTLKIFHSCQALVDISTCHLEIIMISLLYLVSEPSSSHLDAWLRITHCVKSIILLRDLTSLTFLPSSIKLDLSVLPR